jgi:hypothetical protein
MKKPARNSRHLDPREKVDLNQVVLETPLAKQIIHKQMSALAQRAINPSWLTFIQTDAWQQMHKNMLPEAQDRYELLWRIAYKSGLIQDALRKHPPCAGLSDLSIAGHAMVYIWRELADDQPERFGHIRPPLLPYHLEELQLPEIRLRVAGLFSEALRLKVVRLPEPNTDLLESDPDYVAKLDAFGPQQPIVLMTRPDGDVDLVDYEREICEGRLPFTEIRWCETDQLDTAAVPSSMMPGVLIGSQARNEIFQRMPDGSLVNITKHPEKRRRDLEGANESPSDQSK